MDDIEKTQQAIRKLSKKLPRGCTVGTTAAAAPWNKTGRRLWQVHDALGHEIFWAYTSEDLERQLEAN